MQTSLDFNLLDPAEAPDGFYAVPKATVNGEGNICNHCDWRKQCCNPATDLLAHGHRCMADAVVAFREGKTYQRADKTSVVFKKLPVQEKSE